jgi:signal transduction histidine kinase
MMQLQEEVKQELYSLHRSRNRLGYLPTVLAVAFSFFIQRDELLKGSFWILVLFLIFGGTALRILINEVFFEDWAHEKSWAQNLNYLAFAMLGWGLGAHFFDVFTHYGPTSPNAVYILLITAAFVLGATNSLMGHKKTFFVYITSIEVSCMLTLIYYNNTASNFLIVNILIYYFFSISQYRLGHEQLNELLQTRHASNIERDHFKYLIDTVPGFVGLLDKDLRCYAANNTTLKLYPDIIGRRIGDIDPHSKWEEFVMNFMNSDKTSAVTEAHTLFEGRDLWALLNIHRDTNGGAIIVSIITTELVEARKLLREHEAKAQYSSKLASLGEMAAGIAHEINNPLTIIQGSSTIVQKLINQNPIDLEMVRTLSKKIVETTERISKTINSLRALSRNGQKDPMVRVSIEEVLQQCLDLCGNRFKRHDIELIIPHSEKKIIVRGRGVELGQVLLNLLSNAIDATADQEIREVKIDLTIDGNWLNILVSDSGSGVAAEIRSKIMEPFFTTKEVNQGTGLGLSISKAIMENHGGELVLLQDTPRTTFNMRLPYQV